MCVAAAALWLCGCAAWTEPREPRPPPALDPAVPQSVPALPPPLPEELLLDVGIGVEPPAPGDGAEAADLRRSEGAYVAGLLKAALQAAGSDAAACPPLPAVPADDSSCQPPALGHWGAVRLLSRSSTAIDLAVILRVEHSDGVELDLHVRALDARGVEWLNKRYWRAAMPAAYRRGTEPFAPLYAAIAEDLTQHLLALPHAALRAIRDVAELRFADGLLPGAFAPYLHMNEQGELEIRRLPATDSTLMADARRVRNREHLFIDTADEYFAAFSEEVGGRYAEWRRSSYDAAFTQQRLAHEALARQELGAIHLLAGLAQRSTRKGAAVARERAGPTRAALASLADGASLLHAATGIRETVRRRTEMRKAEAVRAGSDLLPATLTLENRLHALEQRTADQYAEARTALQETHLAGNQPSTSGGSWPTAPQPQPAYFAAPATLAPDQDAATPRPAAPAEVTVTAKRQRQDLRAVLAARPREQPRPEQEMAKAKAMMRASEFGAAARLTAPRFVLAEKVRQKAERERLAAAYNKLAAAHVRRGDATGAIAALEGLAAHADDISSQELAAAQFNLAQLRFRQDDLPGAWQAMRAGATAADMQRAACATICSPAAKARAAAIADAVAAGTDNACVTARHRGNRPTDLSHQFRLAINEIRSLIDRGRFASALATIDAKLEQYTTGPEHAMLWRYKASAHSASGNRAGAIQALEKMLDGAGSVPRLSERRAIYDLAHLHLRAGDHGRSLCYQRLWVHETGFARKVCRDGCGGAARAQPTP